jgi:hypothetical protein
MTDVDELQVQQDGAVTNPLETKKVEAKVQATVVLGTPTTADSVQFDCIWRSNADPAGVWHSGPIDLPPKSGKHKLEFTLDDMSGKNLEFYPTGATAMWVDVAACPRSDPGNGKDNGQIHNKDVDPVTKKKLTLTDLNEDEPCLLHYTLRFNGLPGIDPVTGASCPPYEYDPEIKNGGG